MARLFISAVLALLLSLQARAADAPPQKPLQISGIYPHLAAFNAGGECGIGAVVPWAGKLWYITYPPHQRTGSDDKLHEVDPATMALTIRPESVGGTHANRLIHRETNQLIIGPYFIDDKGAVRAADVKKLQGRLTATARHLTDPAGKVYFVDMEGPVWEVDVKTLEPKRLFVKPLPGWHAKGAYTGQGVLVHSNNGENKANEFPGAELPMSKWDKGPEDAGVLGEWDGKELGHPWKIISRRQHVEVTGPGGIYGNANDSDPIWSSGWDKRSLLLHVRDAATNSWSVFRLPKASHTYDPKHGWYTEWPRIREVVPAQNGQPAKLMMTMHGAMFDFPIGFKLGQTAGIRQINSYLRYIPDFCNWNGQVVLASDDTSIMQNPMAGVSQSNLWFGKYEDLASFGPATGWGGVWMGDAIKANEPSDSYLLAGYAKRILHLTAKADSDVTFKLEIDAKGDGKWTEYTKLTIPAGSEYLSHIIPAGVPGEWIRLTADKPCTATAYFHYANPSKFDGKPDPIFASLAPFGTPTNGGLVRPDKEKNLSFLAQSAGRPEDLYEADEKLNFTLIQDPAKIAEAHKTLDLPDSLATGDDASLIITLPKGQRLRLPRGDASNLADLPKHRELREVASERILLNFGGIFYEAPRSESNTAGKADFKNLKPIATHNRAITDYCTWRGLLVLAGTKPDGQPDGHYFSSNPAPGRAGGGAAAGVWCGSIDDLWKFGKPRGTGGPWKNTAIKAGEPSDAYLMTNFDKKTLIFTHDAKEAVTVTIEVDPTNSSFWKAVHKIEAKPGQTTYTFPDGFNAYWVRLSVDKPCTATATFLYE